MKYEVKIRLDTGEKESYYNFLVTASNELEAYKMALEEMLNNKYYYYSYCNTSKVEMKIKEFDAELPEKKSKREIVLK